MIIPSFWAEARIRERDGERQFTVRRFGWSDVNQEEAQIHAESRTRDALSRLIAGEKIPRREQKQAYNGAEGIPIREEIVARHGENIITRNSYGALCLNTPNVLFADIDFEIHTPGKLILLSILTITSITLWYAWTIKSAPWFFLGFFGSLIFGSVFAYFAFRAWIAILGGPEQIARRRINRFFKAHPDWGLRLYRTPLGYRLLVTHRTFDPAEPAVAAFFKKVGADSLYARMCRNQACFRARLTPKPWRAGISKHLRPSPGVWPVANESMPGRLEWIKAYEAASASFAACEWKESLGSKTVDPTVEAVRDLHDAESRALTGLPIA